MVWSRPTAVKGAHTKAHPTLKDVARHAGVSEATASRALHLRPGTIPVHEDTRERVRRAARDLGYRTNHLARGLSRAHTDTLGVLLPFDAANLGRPYNSMILAGVGQTASERGYALALYYADAHARADYAGAMRDGRVDGGLVIDSAVIPADQIERLEQERFPLVLVGHRLPETRTSFVAADDHAAGASVARYLIGLGHRRIVHAYFAGGHPTRQRRAGFENAMAEAGLLRPDTAIEDTIGDMPGSLDHTPLVRELLSRDERPTAIFAWNDTVAASFVQCATTMGVRVPHDLSVVGFNDFAIAQLTSPPLTTVRQPLFDMGRTAADLLIGRIEGERQGGSVDWPAQRVLSAELVERGSTAEPGS